MSKERYEAYEFGGDIADVDGAAKEANEVMIADMKAAIRTMGDREVNSLFTMFHVMASDVEEPLGRIIAQLGCVGWNTVTAQMREEERNAQ